MLKYMEYKRKIAKNHEKFNDWLSKKLKWVLTVFIIIIVIIGFVNILDSKKNVEQFLIGSIVISLTLALSELIRGMGYEAQYILADRSYGQDTHCALIVWIENEPHLLDPGFLILRPIPLPSGSERKIETGFNSIILAKPEEDANRVSLHTVRKNNKIYRLTYKTSPVDIGEFCKAWDASFHWDMMKYPLKPIKIGMKIFKLFTLMIHTSTFALFTMVIWIIMMYGIPD